MVQRKKRDIYGNWVWEEEDDQEKERESPSAPTDEGSQKIHSNDESDDDLSLDFRDYIALTVASLETFLLPLVVLIVIIFAIVIALALLH